MTEKSFWVFMESSWKKGRVQQVSGVIDSDDEAVKEAGRFIESHSLLPEGYDKIAPSIISDMSMLLFNKLCSIPAKEAILIILAHHPSKEALTALRYYNRVPDEELSVFAEFALDECEMWNE